MESLAPEVSREITGTCPACGDSLSATLHVPLLVIDELRRAAANVYDDVHLIASTYIGRNRKSLRCRVRDAKPTPTKSAVAAWRGQ